MCQLPSCKRQAVPVLFAAVGCSTSTPEPTAEQKKSFMGGPMPANFMQQQQAAMKGAQAAAQKAQAAAMAAHPK